jgi:hypothetical protein
LVIEGSALKSLHVLFRPADLPTSRFADKFWLGRSLALQNSPPTEVGVCKDEAC